MVYTRYGTIGGPGDGQMVLGNGYTRGMREGEEMRRDSQEKELDKEVNLAIKLIVFISLPLFSRDVIGGGNYLNVQ